VSGSGGLAGTGQAGAGAGGAGAGGSAGAGGTSTAARTHCKRGVAYGYHSDADLTALSKGVTWWYNWAYHPDATLSAETPSRLGVQYVPMVWGGEFDSTQIGAALSADSGTLLGFNEPNFYAQANLSAQDAAAKWPALEALADAKGLRLASPAVNYCGGGCWDTDPVSYLDDFFAACPGCRVDVIAVHVYVGCNPSGSNHAQWLIDHLQNYLSHFTQPLWVTEFACDDAQNDEQQRQFLIDAVTWMESQPRIERYAWFSGRATNVAHVDLLGADGQLTDLGSAYVSQPAAAGCVLP